MSSQYHEVIKYLLKLEEILDPVRESKLLADILYEIGVMYFKVWDCNNAINYLERSLDLSSKLNYQARKAGCYCNLGNANLRLLNTPNAIKFFRKALDIFSRLDDKRGVANSYLNLGSSYLVQKQFVESTNFYQKGLVIYCQIGHVSGKEKAFKCLGEVCMKEEQYEKAIGYFEKALDVNKITLDKTTERGCYVSLGDAYFSQKQFRKAAEYFQKNYRLLIISAPPALMVPSPIDNLAKKGEEFTKQGMTCLSLGQCKIAIDYFTKSLKVCLETSNLSEAGNVYVGLGNAYLMLKEYQKAKANFSEAVAIFEKLKNRKGLALALIGMGNVYNSTQNFPEAIKSHDKAMNIGIEIRNVAIEGLAHGNLGNAYVGLGDYKRANEHHLKSLSVAIDIGAGQTELAQIYENLGTSYLRLGNYSEAKDFYEKALSINEKMEITERVGTTNGNLATVYARLNQYEKSIELSTKSLAISIELGYAALEAKAYGNLGGVYFQQGKLSEAIDYHEKEAGICRKINDQQELGYAYTNLGNAYHRIGKPQKAINSYMQCISIFEELGDRASLASSFTNLGIVYESFGRFQLAIGCYENGCKIDIQCGNRPSENNTYCHLGNAYYSLGKYEEAIIFHQKHHDISVELGNVLGKSEALANLANVYRSLGEHRKAIDYCEQALTIALEVGKPSEMAKQYSNLAATYQELGNYEKAVEFFKKSCDVSSAMGDKQQEACCNASIGSSYLFTAMNDAVAGNKTIKTRLSDAISLLKKAIRSMDNLLSELVADKDQTSAYNQYYQWHINLACSYILSEKHVNGLLVLDIGKSKALQLWIEGRGSRASEHASANSYREETWKMIETENADTRVRDIAKLLEIQEKDATVLVYALYLEMLHIWVISSDGSFHHKAWMPLHMQESAKDWLLRETKSLFKNVIVDVRGAYSFFEFSRVRFLNDDVSHRIFPDSPSSCSVADQETRFERNPTSSTATEEIPPGNDTTADDVSDPRKKLYQVLIGSVKSLIKGTSLIIVPDNILFFLPFCSLLNESGRPLVNDHSIQMTPSLHTLASSVLVSKEQSLTDPGPALFVGNPSVGEITFRGQPKEIHPLPAAGEEAKSLATKFDAKALVENQATKKRVLERVCNASIVHIAAHGEPDNGEIFLAPNPEAKVPGPLPTEKSYLLRQGDVINRKLTARLVVLSCCHTGRGKVTSEGVLGLARAFLAAGARSILVALWRLPDRETKVFMEHFYDELCNGKTTCKALKASMNMFCQSSDQNRRCFRMWAPFTIFGEDIIFTKNDIEIIKEQSRKIAK